MFINIFAYKYRFIDTDISRQTSNIPKDDEGESTKLSDDDNNNNSVKASWTAKGVLEGRTLSWNTTNLRDWKKKSKKYNE